ncbi:hypothetical protein RG959_00785 [Domibacillus sp. 8LH]
MDYKKEDLSQKKQEYDLILGVNGYQPMSVYKHALRPKGTVGAPMRN